MAAKKQVMDMASSTSAVSKMESNEQQRNWTDEQWKKKANDSLANYDPTRASLNFEVTRGGVVQCIDTSKSIDERMRENLASRGIKNPLDNPNAKMKRRILAKFIFGGNRERMHEIAFGMQKVDFTKGADNSHITRSKDIEEWAKDVYNFVAKKYGEENIVSFYVHLDEMNPHAHCTLLPVDPVKNRISWNAVFGRKLEDGPRILKELHDEYESEVGQKWKLERGSSMSETNARHRSTAEYKRDLVREIDKLERSKGDLLKEIHRNEIKLKGLTTMIRNLEARRDALQKEIDDITKQLKEGGGDKQQLQEKVEALKKEQADIEAKLEERYKALAKTRKVLDENRALVEKLRGEHRQVQADIDRDFKKGAVEVQRNIIHQHGEMTLQSLMPFFKTLSPAQQNIFDDIGLTELAERSNHIINCATMLAMGYIREATNYAESVGGGGGGSSSGWGRDKDDDDERWWRRCIAHAAKLVTPSKRRKSRGR